MKLIILTIAFASLNTWAMEKSNTPQGPSCNEKCQLGSRVAQTAPTPAPQTGLSEACINTIAAQAYAKPAVSREYINCDAPSAEISPLGTGFGTVGDITFYCMPKARSVDTYPYNSKEFTYSFHLAPGSACQVVDLEQAAPKAVFVTPTPEQAKQ